MYTRSRLFPMLLAVCVAGLLTVMWACSRAAEPATVIPVGDPALDYALPANGSEQEFGHLFEAFGAANWAGGRYPGAKFSYSFRARHGGELEAMWICWITLPGYGAGNYGKWDFELQTDDPQGHQPSGNVVAAMREVQITPRLVYFRLDLPNVALQEGAVYHLVMYNVDPQPQANWSSPNTIIGLPDATWRGEGVMAQYKDTKWAPWGTVVNPRAPRQGSRGPYLLEFADGHHEGQPYYSAKKRFIYGQLAEAERFTWRGAQTNITRLGFPVFRTGEPKGPLTITVEDGEGTVLAQGVLAMPKDVRKGANTGWHHVTLNPSVTLETGKAYRLKLTAPECMEKQHGYGIYVPFTSKAIPGWVDVSWGGADGASMYFDGQWHDAVVPADMTFSLVGQR